MINHKSEYNLKKAIDLLDKTYGNHVLIAERIVQNLFRGGSIRNVDELNDLYAEMQSSLIAMEKLNRKSELDSQNILKDIVKIIKIDKIQELWFSHVRNMLGEWTKYPTFDDFVKFMAKQQSWANDFHYGIQHSSSARITTHPRLPHHALQLNVSLVMHPTICCIIAHILLI